MDTTGHKSQYRLSLRSIAALVIVVFSFSAIVPPWPVYAQQPPSPLGVNNLNLPLPGTLVTLTSSFTPAIVRGIKIFPDNPLRFDFIVDPGDSKLEEEKFKEESTKLIKYFLASVTVPEDELWVNLSPYEGDRIIPEAFGVTEMGRDLLAQDYILKQLTASLLYPEDDLGNEFWKRVYQKAYEKYGTSEIPINTFNKVWIVPEKAVVYTHGNTAFVAESHLKVMLEGDYLALKENLNNEEIGTDQLEEQDVEEISDISSAIVREVILPAIEKEVNEGQNFAPLRQMYYSMILATWFKQYLRKSFLGKVYMDQNKIDGVDIEDKDAKEKIYAQYLEAFKTGVYNYIKEDYDPATQEIIPRKYFSGGFEGTVLSKTVVSDEATLGEIQSLGIRPLSKTVSVLLDYIRKKGAEGAPKISRRGFLKSLGLGGAYLAANPQELFAFERRRASHPSIYEQLLQTPDDELDIEKLKEAVLSVPDSGDGDDLYAWQRLVDRLADLKEAKFGRLNLNALTSDSSRFTLREAVRMVSKLKELESHHEPLLRNIYNFIFQEKGSQVIVVTNEQAINLGMLPDGLLGRAGPAKYWGRPKISGIEQFLEGHISDSDFIVGVSVGRTVGYFSEHFPQIYTEYSGSQFGLTTLIHEIDHARTMTLMLKKGIDTPTPSTIFADQKHAYWVGSLAAGWLRLLHLSDDPLVNVRGSHSIVSRESGGVLSEFEMKVVRLNKSDLEDIKERIQDIDGGAGIYAAIDLPLEWIPKFRRESTGAFAGIAALSTKRHPTASGDRATTGKDEAVLAEKTKEDYIQELKKAYAQVKEGEVRRIDLTNSGLVNLKHGIVAQSFPLAEEKGSWGEAAGYLKLGINLEKVEVLITREGGQLKLTFIGTKKDKEAVQSDRLWDSEKFIYQTKEDEKSQAIQALKEAYAKVPEGEVRRIDLTNSGLVNLKDGKVASSFPLAEEKGSWGKQESLKLGINLEKVEVLITREGGQLKLTFIGTKKDKEAVQSDCLWDGGKFIYQAGEKQGEQQKRKKKTLEALKKAYAQVSEGEVRRIDLTNSGLVNLKDGKVANSFPLAEEKGSWGEAAGYLKLGINLEKVEVLITREGGQLKLTFIGTKKDKEAVQSDCLWDGGKFIYQAGEKEAEQKQRKEKTKQELKAAYAEVQEGEVRRIDLTNSGLVNLKHGIVAQSFPLAEEKGSWEKAAGYLKLGINLEKVEVQITREEGQLRLTFIGYKEQGNVQESGRSQWVWKDEAFVYFSKEEQIADIIQDYNLTELVSSHAGDPYILSSYLMITTNLPPETVRRIVTHSFRGIGGFNPDVPYRDDYTLTSDTVTLEQYPATTEEYSVVIRGQVQGDYSFVQFEGDRRRIVSVDDQGNFSVRFILQRGQEIHLEVFGFDEDRGERSQPQNITIQQSSPPKDAIQTLEELMQKRQDVMEKIEQNPEQFRYVTRHIELGLLIHFTESEEEGFQYLEDKIAQTDNELLKRLYQAIKIKFKKIDQLKLPEDFKDDQKLYFYQKYAWYEMTRRLGFIENGEEPNLPGVILALEQGLGKTLVVLTALRDHEEGAMIIAPNAVVSSWGEQEGLFFDNKRLVEIKGSGPEKTETIEKAGKVPKVVNVEYLRVGEKTQTRRVEAMNTNPEQFVVLDESQFISRTGSLQTETARALQGSAKILVSATPFSNLKTARAVLKFLEEGSRAYDDSGVFKRLFQSNDPESLRLLHFLFDQFVIRIKKEHVFRQQEVGKPLKKNRLPRKKEVDPKELGEYELTMDQAESLLTLFTDWPTWQRGQIEREQQSDRITEDDAILRRGRGENYFSKVHSLRQVVNDPRYIGLEAESPKHRKMDEIIEREVEALKGKVVVFARYREEVKAYQRRFARHGAVTFYGDTGEEFRTNGAGNIVDRKGKEQKYKIEKGRSPFVSEEGVPLTPLDYNRHAFQNDPNVKVLVATYETGSLGVTFTAANAVIRDDLARDYTEQYQADDRAHRIDNERLKGEVRYYNLISRYPEEFLQATQGLFLVQNTQTGERNILSGEKALVFAADPVYRTVNLYEGFFRQGTYDQVQHGNLDTQRRIFTLILDGLQGEEEISALSNQRLREQMPFLFDTSPPGTHSGIDGDGAALGSDAAMKASAQSEVGGINLDANMLELEERGSTIPIIPGVPCLDADKNWDCQEYDFQYLETIPINGFTPIIFQITPTNLPAFLGASDNEERPLELSHR